jgi:hypothetical protein
VDLHAKTHRGLPALTGTRTLIKGLFTLCHMAAPSARGLLRSGHHTAVRALTMEPPWRCGARLVWQPLRKQRGSRGIA